MFKYVHPFYFRSQEFIIAGNGNIGTDKLKQSPVVGGIAIAYTFPSKIILAIVFARVDPDPCRYMFFHHFRIHNSPEV